MAPRAKREPKKAPEVQGDAGEKAVGKAPEFPPIEAAEGDQAPERKNPRPYFQV
jgi:hypothetical protein